MEPLNLHVAMGAGLLKSTQGSPKSQYEEESSLLRRDKSNRTTILSF
jgi:hypothetical protein